MRAEKCSVIEQKSVFHHVKTEWEGTGEKMKHRIQNSWLNVLWKDNSSRSFSSHGRKTATAGDTSGSSLISRKVAEEFFQAVCAWGYDVRGEILVFHNGDFQKDKQLFESIKSTTFDNLVLPGSLKQQIENDFQQFLESREVYERYRIRGNVEQSLLVHPETGRPTR